MKHWTPIATAASLAMAISAQSAAADLTAEQAWGAITSISESYGKVLTGTPSKSGDTLTIKDAAVAFEVPNLKIGGKIGDIALLELGDGSVAVTIPEDYSLDVAASRITGRQ